MRTTEADLRAINESKPDRLKPCPDIAAHWSDETRHAFPGLTQEYQCHYDLLVFRNGAIHLTIQDWPLTGVALTEALARLIAETSLLMLSREEAIALIGALQEAVNLAGSQK